MDGMLKFGLFMLIVTGIPALGAAIVTLAKGYARRFEGTAPAEVDALRAEVAELRGLPERVQELEERLDFAERMLAQRREADRLPPPAR
jgi:hypothetical protein